MLKRNTFSETLLNTKLGTFNFRVYKDQKGQETIVVHYGNLDTKLPVLARVHSECITSEVFGSLHCDCGEQLDKSLKLIKKHGGILIYLRQEGRGIGLFEKVKAYDLQKKGYDTVEANIALGHSPDERTYEMVKTALDDLQVDKIYLLTNNPSKVSEISKLGIKVEERLPLCIKSNEINKKYFQIKREKFQHEFSERSLTPYFYQFKVSSPDQVFELKKFIENKTFDPLLKFCIGLNMDTETYNDQIKMNHIKKIIKACIDSDFFEPIIHFSFLCSFSYLNDLEKLKKSLTNIKRVQLNDLDRADFIFFNKASELFKIDIPLSDENLDIIEDKDFQDLVKKKNLLLAIDNSKGRGIQESELQLKNKINKLLSYGINNIAIHGGFGPDNLQTYFSLRRYFKFNLSIDAESGLKDNNQFDTERIKLYLTQLIQFNDPKSDAIKQTKQFLTKHRKDNWDKVNIYKTEFLVHPKVFHPGHFPSSKWFADNLIKKLTGKIDFCEVGCGTGIISCLLALKNPQAKIAATDINPNATKNTEINSINLNLEKQIQVYNGDVFDGLDRNLSFDSIFWALPFGYLDPGAKLDSETLQVFDPGYRATRKFFQTAKNYLKPGGELLIGFSSELGHSGLLKEIAEEFNYKLKKIGDTILSETESIKFEILSATLINQFENVHAV